MKSALDMFKFSFKWSQMIVPYNNISMINNILDCQLRPGGFLKALRTLSFNPWDLSMNRPLLPHFLGAATETWSFNRLPEVLETSRDKRKIQI